MSLRLIIQKMYTFQRSRRTLYLQNKRLLTINQRKLNKQTLKVVLAKPKTIKSRTHLKCKVPITTYSKPGDYIKLLSRTIPIIMQTSHKTMSQLQITSPLAIKDPEVLSGRHIPKIESIRILHTMIKVQILAKNHKINKSLSITITE